MKMPWKEKTVKSMRETFVNRVLEREKSMSALCREYGISRKTGYKWLERARSGQGLEDLSRAPKQVANKTHEAVEKLILQTRDEHPAWGPRKLGRHLENKGYEELPSKSTIGNIIKRNNRIEPETSESHKPMRRFEYAQPNELWQMDYKGDFGLLDGKRCYPLIIIDDHSRYSLSVKASGGITYKEFKPELERVFEEYGLPKAIMCDNGKPWGDSKGGITTFDVWMMQLRILPLHIRPKHPQTQGKCERFNGTLNREVIKRRMIANLTEAQQLFDPWREEYNRERPHEALGMEVPAKRYRVSKRKYSETLKEPEYETGARLRKVNYKGYISINQHRYYIGEALTDKYLLLCDDGEDELRLHYGKYQIAKINLNERMITSKHIYKAP